ncbi:DMT family transporter [Clostridium sp. NSJ-6]|uniref:DMT family transporter n=1 Tax=Clostridium hominis TaxID=2763036 RepID=A0ABR7DBG8_9CLOT|nr:DMT family transporter [Clostridium hominis]MBC5628043.1 DMT family transporter [Clostridium hominis]MDU2673194.1 DMT family transporter [Clostridium sp.]
MVYGLLSGLLWGLDTVLLGIALAMSQFVSTEQAIFLAPFVSTFLHDAFSSIWMAIYMMFKREIKKTFNAAKTRSGRFIVLGALLGGPVGMTGYLLAIKYIGPAYTAIISSLYPAVGALFSYIFLKEKMKPISILGLFISISGIIALGYTPGGEVNNMLLGFAFAILCVVGWASEAVICAYGMKEDEITPEQSLQIRQLTSAVTYGFVIIPIVKGINFTMSVVPTTATVIIILTALAGTASYVFYYKGIYKLGATKAMALNITYSAWSIIFGVILLKNALDLKMIVCCICIMVGSVMAAGDIKEIVEVFKVKKTTKGNV